MGMFSRPKMPPLPPVPPPTPIPPQPIPQPVQTAVLDEETLKRRRRGLTDTILTSPLGLGNPTPIGGYKTLLGQ